LRFFVAVLLATTRWTTFYECIKFDAFVKSRNMHNFVIPDLIGNP